MLGFIPGPTWLESVWRLSVSDTCLHRGGPSRKDTLVSKRSDRVGTQMSEATVGPGLLRCVFVGRVGSCCHLPVLIGSEVLQPFTRVSHAREAHMYMHEMYMLHGGAYAYTLRSRLVCISYNGDSDAPPQTASGWHIHARSFGHTHDGAKNSKVAERTACGTGARQRSQCQYFSSFPVRAFFVSPFPFHRGSLDMSRFLLYCDGSMPKPFFRFVTSFADDGPISS